MMLLIFFIILLICANPSVQNNFAKLFGKDKPTEITGFVLALIFAAGLVLYHRLKKTNEPFLFKVSKFNPRCGGLYVGKPTTFQYDRIGCNYNVPVTGNNPDFITNNGKSIQPYCTPEANPPLGYIVGDEKRDVLYDGDPKLFTNYGDTNYNP